MFCLFGWFLSAETKCDFNMDFSLVEKTSLYRPDNTFSKTSAVVELSDTRGSCQIVPG